MEYFSGFPKTTRNNQLVKDITIRIDFLRKIKDNVAIFQFVQIQAGQRPEDIANKYYNDPTLFWIVLYLNDIVDPYHGWLLTDDQLYKYATQKYVDINATHHYETTSSSDLGAGIIVDEFADFKVAVTNLTYEQTINESRRKIKILKSSYIQQVLSEYTNELGR